MRALIALACLSLSSALMLPSAARPRAAGFAARSVPRVAMPIMQEDKKPPAPGVEKNPIAVNGSKIAFGIVFLALIAGGVFEDQIEANVVGNSAIAFPDPGKEGRELKKAGEEIARQKKLQEASTLIFGEGKYFNAV